jgi:uncharacterized protein YgfB (UPF0149 family)
MPCGRAFSRRTRGYNCGVSDSLRYDQLADALTRLGYAQNPAEYHGALCGALCVREVEDIDPLAVLERAGATADGAEAATAALRELRVQSASAFGGSEMTFSPLLPDDDEDLPQRVAALSAWCEGFLYGLSTGAPLNMKQCSPELKEIVRDFTEFTHAGIGDEDDGELEETAYAELVEYIRVGAQLIFMELHERPSQAASPPQQIH